MHLGFPVQYETKKSTSDCLNGRSTQQSFTSIRFVSFVAEEHEEGRSVESSIIKDEGGAFRSGLFCKIMMQDVLASCWS